MLNSVNKRDFHFRDFTNTNNSNNHDRLSSETMSINNLDHSHLVETISNNSLPFCNSSTNVTCVLKSPNIKTHKSNVNDEHSNIQCLQTPTALNQAEWNSRMLLNLSAEIKNETPKKKMNISRENKQSDSAFNNDNLKRNITVFTLDDSHILTTQIEEAEDQGRALYRIEDVHNYAKLSEYSYSNESSESSIHEGESEIDDVDDTEDFTANKTFKNAFCKIHSQDKFNNNNNNNNNNNVISKNLTCTSKDNIKHSQNNDCSAIPHSEQDHFVKGSIKITPDHHARRPMNAFLIFCKRHRAIVKAKYKSLENRAITKILGDWWASLDSNDKKSFTDLAEQNKAAFFSANPNFKWYKLPAPSLRTLSTRPNNNDLTEDQQIQEERQYSKSYKRENYFKLADEAQMGELNTLICDKNVSIDNQLQQVLGETREFLSAHIPITLLKAPSNSCTVGVKRRLYSENILSKSNDNVDDIIIKNTGRSCKGKIYQELKKSGQIAVITKKIKGPKGHCVNDVDHKFVDNCHETSKASTSSSMQNVRIHCDVLNTVLNNKRRVVSESDSHSYEVIAFDLEEKIKELPALSLEGYLQRKRSIKKKKKFPTNKKRHSNNVKNVSISLLQTTQNLSLAPQVATITAAVTAVGSQKRKARKESITRRNVNAIESETASIVPSVSCYTNANENYNLNESVLTSPEISTTSSETNKLQPNWNSEHISHFNEHILSTSDPLDLLAEVAANRTELNNL